MDKIFVLMKNWNKNHQKEMKKKRVRMVFEIHPKIVEIFSNLQIEYRPDEEKKIVFVTHFNEKKYDVFHTHKKMAENKMVYGGNRSLSLFWGFWEEELALKRKGSVLFLDELFSLNGEELDKVKGLFYDFNSSIDFMNTIAEKHAGKEKTRKFLEKYKKLRR